MNMLVISHVLLRLQDDVEFNTGKMLSFTPGLGQQVNTSTNFGDLQVSQKVRMRCLLSSVCLFSGPSSIYK